jgi:tetratricopeptide (TPR) repeat protein
MNKNFFWLSLIAVIISFIAGFLLANALNRKELDNLRAEAGRLKNPSQTSAETSSEPSLSDEEIRQKIAEADKNPDNIEYQKSLGMALYRYASMKQETRWLKDVARLLHRAYEKNPKDYNTIISLGNIYFDIAETGTENSEQNSGEKNQMLEKSREFYQKALEINPNDADLRTDLGMTYLLENPPKNDKAISEFQKSLQINPKNERALENITRAFLGGGKTKEAEEYLGRLKEANPQNSSVQDLETRLAQNKNS